MAKKVPKFRQQKQQAGRSSGGATQPENSPPLVINVYTWWVPIVGLAMLIVGFLIGYFVRPAASGAKSAADAADQAEIQPVAATPTVDPVVVQATRDAVMVSLVGQVKHFKGDVDAPVTMIEFSDFQ